MKKFLTYFASILFIGAITLTSCNKDAVIVSEISGTVTFVDGAADGAIVYLSTAPNAAAVISTVVANADGKYTFMAVEDGSYSISAVYNTDNMNNMKSNGLKFMTAADVDVTIEESAVVQDITVVSNTSTGTGSVDLANGWAWDDTHSSVGFEFAYDADNAIFVGQFGNLDWTNATGTDFTMFKFDEANPANTSFSARVNLAWIETGSPTLEGGHGRDHINGCIAGTFGIIKTESDTTDTGWVNETAISHPTGYAYLTSKSVVAYGNGYKAVCDFTFHGLTTEVDMYFQYIVGHEGEDRSGNPTAYSSLQGWFTFNALADHNIDSGHIGTGDVKVTASIQFTKAL